jgi:Signal transduction histidine kinase
MTTTQRRACQIGVLAVATAACLAPALFLPLEPLLFVVVTVLVPGSAFVLAGLAAWSLRPTNRIGPLMVAVGLGRLIPGAFSVMPYGVSPSWLLALVNVFDGLWLVFLLHLLLAFPGGILKSRFERRLVRSLYVAAPVAGLLQVLALNGLHSLQVREVVWAGADGIYLACLILGLGVIMRRWLKGGSAARRSMSPVLWSIFPVTIAFFGTLVGFLLYEIPRDNSWANNLLMVIQVFPALLTALPIGILIGLVRAQMDMSSVGNLVIKLSDGLLPEQLQPALAQALHDPSLTVVYWLPDLARFSDLEGRQVELPASDENRAVSVLGEPESPIGALIYDAALRNEARLLETAAAAVRLALENARLQVQLRAKLEEVRQSRARLVDAADSERRRLERDIHDGAQQQLVTMLLSLQMANVEAHKRSDTKLSLVLEGNIETLKQALSELRELARGIHPTILVEAGLAPAIRSLAERCPIPVDVAGDPGRLDPRLEAALYFVAAEAITNAVKHSHGRRIHVGLQRDSAVATIDVSDDGVGGADVSRGSGLVGLADRVAAVGGRLDVKSIPGSGTKLHVEIPCA